MEDEQRRAAFVELERLRRENADLARELKRACDLLRAAYDEVNSTELEPETLAAIQDFFGR